MMGVRAIADACCVHCACDIFGPHRTESIGGELRPVCAGCANGYVTLPASRSGARKRRVNTARQQRLLDAGLCINGTLHGPNVDGTRCAWCIAVHKHGLAAVLADPNHPPRPKSKRRRAP